MNPQDLLDEARTVGRAATTEGLDSLRHQLQRQIRRSLGFGDGPPPPPCSDPDRAYFPPGSIIRTVNGDLPAMLIGGVAALLFQMLHPLTMAGVAQHSNYREDPLGRLNRTATFLTATTFQARDEAEAAIARVRKVHASVIGVAPDGRPYAASDPALLTWVHAAEIRCFLNSALIYGPHPLPIADQDRYVDETAKVAIALGAVDVPHSVADLDRYFAAVRPELCLTSDARTARNFVLRGVGRWPHEVGAYGLLVAAAQGALPGWARRQMHLPAPPAVDRLAVRPAARTVGAALRWVVASPARPDDSRPTTRVR